MHRYRAYSELTGIPHVVVDGSAQAGTELTLSHWPGSATPAALRADLSAEIAFHYLDHPEHHVDVEWVTNNHFDQDGLVGVFALTDPEAARPRRDRLVDVARAGDFGRFEDRASARAAITIADLGLGAEGDPYPEMLGRLVDVVDHPDRYERHWADQDRHIAATEAAIADGTITITEDPAVDLAVVHVPPSWRDRTVARFATLDAEAAHPYAVHNATDRLAILTVGSGRPTLRYRYEGWVLLASRRPRPRVDLRALAEDLTAADTATWAFDGVDGLSPALRVTHGETTLAPDAIAARVTEVLRAAAATWTPFRD